MDRRIPHAQPSYSLVRCAGGQNVHRHTTRSLPQPQHHGQRTTQRRTAANHVSGNSLRYAQLHRVRNSNLLCTTPHWYVANVRQHILRDMRQVPARLHGLPQRPH